MGPGSSSAAAAILDDGMSLGSPEIEGDSHYRRQYDANKL